MAPSTLVDAPPGSVPPPPSPPVPDTSSKLIGSGLVLAAIVLVALNLRTAVTSLGALLEDVSAGLRMSGTLAGVITMLPALSFAAFGALTPRLARRLGATRLLLVAMSVLAAGLAVRALTDSTAVFVVTSAAALSGIAVGNVLLPSVVMRYFPHKVGMVTGVYSMTLVVGTATAAATSVPVAHLAGSWRAGLGVWALLAAVAIVPLVVVARMSAAESRAATVRATAEPARAARPASRVRASRTRLGWAMALLFGAQSFGAYAVMSWLAQLFRDAGFSAEVAGLLLSGVMAIGIPIALFMPAVAARWLDQRVLISVLAVVTAAAYVGLLVAPRSGALLWVALLAVGHSTFPLILSLLGMRARTAAGTVALSAFAQSVGYLIAAAGPLLIGVLYEATGAWVAPVGVLLGALVVQATCGLAVGRPRTLEDELDSYSEKSG
ncbi:CynX/NimT family MFS transporter [Luedemannella helvata]|uniref:CynX/NimT family MFS transporter n=1 Tax=Luedemannella helvata TaxID=349315 RepID=A0ABN2K0H1_9ACTN